MPPTWAPLKFHSIIIIILWTERMLSRAEQCCAGQLSKPISIHFILITVAPPASGAGRHQHCPGSGGRENMLQETDLQTRTVTEDVVGCGQVENTQSINIKHIYITDHNNCKATIGIGKWSVLYRPRPLPTSKQPTALS